MATYLSKEDFLKISALEHLCTKEGVALKLELDYKLCISKEAEENTESFMVEGVNEFMYFIEDDLIGYIGICGFVGIGSQIEINGMVHPEYRRRGCFKTLFELVRQEFHKRESRSLLLLSDHKSEAGQAFIKSTQATYKHTEYEMYLNKALFENVMSQGAFDRIESQNFLKLRKATNADSKEIEAQNVIYFKEEFDIDIKANGLIDGESDSDSEDQDNLIKPEEEEKRGMTIFIAYEKDQIIGKTHIQLSEGLGGIYGLGVLPAYRGKGYGRWLLMKSVQVLLESGADKVMLQVEANNSNALKLYQSSGFSITSTMDYYQILK